MRISLLRSISVASLLCIRRQIFLSIGEAGNYPMIYPPFMSFKIWVSCWRNSRFGVKKISRGTRRQYKVYNYLPLSIRLLCEPEQFLQICLSPWQVIIVSDTYVAIQFYNINCRVGTLCRKRRFRLLSLVHRLFEYSLHDHPFGLNFDIAPKKT